MRVGCQNKKSYKECWQKNERLQMYLSEINAEWCSDHTEYSISENNDNNATMKKVMRNKKE